MTLSNTQNNSEEHDVFRGVDGGGGGGGGSAAAADDDHDDHDDDHDDNDDDDGDDGDDDDNESVSLKSCRGIGDHCKCKKTDCAVTQS
ncbi:hypothetical protein ElyMa_000704600 [Elysia marginata]|uniref:Uncharacterized protein n=1 Tax=Elysia marginata TaxID=1093978 RepID=A0AAV4GN15_9GAST|nr:hypothetical protein ElyMa_000704600 [Elysia marginata]